jgi:glycosyltransferase involved in cell wall biosynthesis
MALLPFSTARSDWLTKNNGHPHSPSVLRSPDSAVRNPLVSVIVPTFNRPAMLKETLTSIDAQTYAPIEIIVINDGGTEIEPPFVPLNVGRKVVHLKHGTNRGLPAARNTGLNAASGEYIAYVDDDDIYYPDHIEMLVSFLVNSTYKVAYTDAYEVREVKRGTFLGDLFSAPHATSLYVFWRLAPNLFARLLQGKLGAFAPGGHAFRKLADSRVDPFVRADGKYLVVNRRARYSNDFDRDALLVKNFVPVLCLMHHRSCVEQAGLFDETLTSHEDWDFWIRIARECPFAHIKEVTCEYTQRADGSNMSSYRRADFRRTMKIIHKRYRYLVENSDVIKAQNAILGSLS